MEKIEFERKNPGKPRYNRASNAIVAYVLTQKGKTPNDIAKFLSVNVRSVYRYLKDGEIAKEILHE